MKIKRKGFTIIELLITLSVMGILTAMAIPYLTIESSLEVKTIRKMAGSLSIKENYYKFKNGDYLYGEFTYSNGFISDANSKIKIKVPRKGFSITTSVDEAHPGGWKATITGPVKYKATMSSYNIMAHKAVPIKDKIFMVEKDD